MNNTSECLKNISKIQTILDNIALLNYKRINSSELLDAISIIQEHLDNQQYLDLPIFVEETEKEIKFNFWIYYNELDEFNNNEVVITKDLKELLLDSNYGQFHFYEKFIMNNNKITKEHSDKNNYYKMTIAK